MVNRSCTHQTSPTPFVRSAEFSNHHCVKVRAHFVSLQRASFYNDFILQRQPPRPHVSHKLKDRGMSARNAIGDNSHDIETLLESLHRGER